MEFQVIVQTFGNCPNLPGRVAGEFFYSVQLRSVLFVFVGVDSAAFAGLPYDTGES
jgi:hypothetical protein